MSRHNDYLSVTEEVDVDIYLPQYKEQIIEWLKAENVTANVEKYKELRDLLHYNTITQQEFMAQLDEMMGYKRNG